MLLIVLILATARACGPGAYTNGSICAACPSGFYQPFEGELSCFDCARGSFSSGGANECTECSPNFFSAERAQTQCSECPSGWSQPLNGGHECSACRPGTQKVGHECVACIPGFFRNTSMSDCAPCRALTFQPSPKSISCLTCPRGQYQDNAGSTNCLDCPTTGPCCTGYESTNGTCRVCNSSSYELQGTCVACPARHVPAFSRLGVLSTVPEGANTCMKCPNGTMVNGSLCQPCRAGTFEQNNVCLPCPVNTAQSEDSQSECLDCSAGFFASDTGQSACQPCPFNHFGNASGCFACESPLVSPLGSENCYVTCPGEWLHNGSTCIGCPLGETVSNGTCVSCSPGKARSKHYESECTACDGETKPDSEHVSCICPAGMRVSDSSCTNCSSGRYQPNEGEHECKSCAGGTYSGVGLAVCTDCPSGYVTFGNGSSSCALCPSGRGDVYGQCQDCQHGQETASGICVACPAGKQAAAGSGCEDCEFGKVSSSAGSECEFCAQGEYSFSTSECRSCDISNNEYTNKIGMGSTYCVVCDSNTACQSCEPGRFNALGSCAQCPTGYINDGSMPNCLPCSSTDISTNNGTECETCEDGKRRSGNDCQDCTTGSFGTGGRCTLCPIAKYADVTGTDQCKDCPQGKTTRSVGHSLITECRTCADLEEFSSTIILDGYCTNCAPGKYIEGGQCVNCAPGKYRLASQTVCDECAIGRFGDGSTPCQECPVGFYNTGRGLTECEQCITQGAHASACEECAAGYRKEGAACIACHPGTFSVTGQVQCQDCAVGLFQDQSAAPSCRQCSPGMFADDVSSETCKNCVIGRFQPEYGQGACHKCPSGKYGNEEGLDTCRECPAGSYTENEASESIAQCIACPTGKMESMGVCIECREGSYQNLVGQSECVTCPDNGMSPVAATNANDCFSLDGMVSYVFGMKPDSKASSVHTKKCEVRPNTVLLCPGCSCYSDSRNGFWDGPLCNECRRGFATRDCTVGCANYDGVHDSTMCSGNGKCWFGKNGNGLCYCGGHSKLDSSGENAVVDVRMCPKGKICSSYGDEEQSETTYRPLYYIIQYRQYSSFVLQLNQYTPERGHMWFQRYGLTNAYENTCQRCVGKYENNINTRVGFWNRNGQYESFRDMLQTKNGFHGENCQYECGLCLNGGRCNNVAHPYTYSYSIEDTYTPQKTVYLPITKCICSSITFSTDHMCCPNGFQPYIYYGVRNSVPYSRFTDLPLITDIVNKQQDYWIDRDLLLEPNIRIPYEEPPAGTMTLANNNRHFSENADIVEKSFKEHGPYNKHKFYGVPRNMCRACPGLFGKGVRSQSVQIDNENDAESFWWDNAFGASSRKCNGVGVCDFYNYADEEKVHFMGDADTHTLVSNQRTCQGLATMSNAGSVQGCAKNSEPSEWFVFSETYLGGSVDDMVSTNGTLKLWNSASDAELASNGKGYASFSNETHVVWTVLNGDLPVPDANSPYRIYPPNVGACAAYDMCDTFVDSPGSRLFQRKFGHGSDRLPEATFNRFDTCFTFSLNNTMSTIGDYITSSYEQGLDPFLGGWCPKGHFCSEHDGVGYKEACPAGYYQPNEGVTRSVVGVQCSKSETIEEGCKTLDTTSWPFDFVDKVCIRCDRNEWSAVGSASCSTCPQGRVKKISGIFNVRTPMLNFPRAIEQTSIWYYQANETGVMMKDCALVPESIVHVPSMDKHMSYARSEFLPVLSCPYGFSSRPGTFTSDVGEDANLERVMYGQLPQTSMDTIDSILDAPYVHMKPTYEYKKTATGQTCETESMIEITSEASCRSAAKKLGIATLVRQNGVKGCTYMPNIDPTVVFWSTKGPQTCIQPIQYLCRDGETNDNVFGHFVRSYCFFCPGSSITGPESGTCTTCFENKMKYYAKSALRKIAQQSTLDMKDRSTGIKLTISFDEIENIALEPTPNDYPPSLEAEPITAGMFVSLEDCYLICQQVEELTAVGVKDSSCACSTSNSIAQSPENDWDWYEKSKAQIFDWADEALPLCTSCQPGQFKLNGCSNCPIGFYTSTTFEANRPECQVCTPGYYQDEEASPLCRQCPSGFFQDAQQGLSCKKCAAGKYQYNTAQAFCMDCFPGFHQPYEGQSLCAECMPGQYNVFHGQTRCKDCEPGKFSVASAAIRCNECEPGRYVDQHGSSAACTECPSGWYQTSKGQKVCISCQKGKYSSAGGASDVCKECPSGWYQNTLGRSNCHECRGGSTCRASEEGDECTDGTYVQSRTWATGCTDCEAETTSNSQRTACQTCADGRTTFGEAAAACDPCPASGILLSTGYGKFSPSVLVDGFTAGGTMKTWLISRSRQLVYVVSDRSYTTLRMVINNKINLGKVTRNSGISDLYRYGLVAEWDKGDIGHIEGSCQYAWSYNRCKITIMSVPIPDTVTDTSAYYRNDLVRVASSRVYTAGFHTANATFFTGDPVTLACL